MTRARRRDSNSGGSEGYFRRVPHRRRRRLGPRVALEAQFDDHLPRDDAFGDEGVLLIRWRVERRPALFQVRHPRAIVHATSVDAGEGHSERSVAPARERRFYPSRHTYQLINEIPSPFDGRVLPHVRR